MVSPWVAGALKGVEKGLAQRELQRKNDLANTFKLMTLQSTLASNKLKQEKLIQEKNEKVAKEKTLQHLSGYTPSRTDDQGNVVPEVVKVTPLSTMTNQTPKALYGLGKFHPSSLAMLARKGALATAEKNTLVQNIIDQYDVTKTEAEDFVNKRYKWEVDRITGKIIKIDKLKNEQGSPVSPVGNINLPSAPLGNNTLSNKKVNQLPVNLGEKKAFTDIDIEIFGNKKGIPSYLKNGKTNPEMVKFINLTREKERKDRIRYGIGSNLNQNSTINSIPIMGTFSYIPTMKNFGQRYRNRVFGPKASQPMQDTNDVSSLITRNSIFGGTGKIQDKIDSFPILSQFWSNERTRKFAEYRARMQGLRNAVVQVNTFGERMGKEAIRFSLLQVPDADAWFTNPDKAAGQLLGLVKTLNVRAQFIKGKLKDPNIPKNLVGPYQEKLGEIEYALVLAGNPWTIPKNLTLNKQAFRSIAEQILPRNIVGMLKSNEIFLPRKKQKTKEEERQERVKKSMDQGKRKKQKPAPPPVGTNNSDTMKLTITKIKKLTKKKQDPVGVPKKKTPHAGSGRTYLDIPWDKSTYDPFKKGEK